jgi:hypothetical protein
MTERKQVIDTLYSLEMRVTEETVQLMIMKVHKSLMLFLVITLQKFLSVLLSTIFEIINFLPISSQKCRHLCSTQQKFCHFYAFRTFSENEEISELVLKTS